MYIYYFYYILILANSIKCYRCSKSIHDENCNNKYEVDCDLSQAPNYIQDAAGHQRNWINSNNIIYPSGCYKKQFLSKINNREYVLTQRDCFYGDINDHSLGCLKDPNSSDHQKSCDVCTTDLCNNSIKISPSTTITIFTSILFGIFLMKYY